MSFQNRIRRLAGWAASVALIGTALSVNPVLAQEAQIRKNLSERLSELGKVDEVTKSVVPGLYEVRVGTDIYYSDEQGNFLLEGMLLDTRTRVNLTEARLNKVIAAELPSRYKDAVVWKQGNGSRKLVVFSDPNCGYCKRLERDLQNVKDVTVYTFLVGILGADSNEKARNIWCAKDSTQTYRSWMLSGDVPDRAMGKCDVSALERNQNLMRRFRFNGTPALVFEDGRKVGGALGTEELERRLAEKPKG
jgi:thiol:disulfide interchange protein DsbC